MSCDRKPASGPREMQVGSVHDIQIDHASLRFAQGLLDTVTQPTGELPCSIV